MPTHMPSPSSNHVCSSSLQPSHIALGPSPPPLAHATACWSFCSAPSVCSSHGREREDGRTENRGVRRRHLVPSTHTDCTQRGEGVPAVDIASQARAVLELHVALAPGLSACPPPSPPIPKRHLQAACPATATHAPAVQVEAHPAAGLHRNAEVPRARLADPGRTLVRGREASLIACIRSRSVI